MKRWHVLVGIALGVIVLVLSAGAFKTDPESVKRYVTERLAQQFPGATVNDVSASEIELQHPNGLKALASIERTQTACRREPRHCVAAVDQLLITLMEALENDVRPEVEALRPVIVSRADTDRVEVTDSADANASVPPRSLDNELADDLLISYQLVNQDSMTRLTEPARRKLGIPADKLRKVAIGMLEHHTPEPTLAPYSSHRGVYELRGVLSNSQLLSATRVELVQRLLRTTALAASVPSRGRTLVADATQPAHVNALREATTRLHQSAAHPLSPQLFFVAPDGWQPMP